MSILNIGGAGIGLTLPPNTYANNPVGGTNRFSLPAGSVQTIPSGNWWIATGPYAVVQFLEPVSGMWLRYSDVADGPGIMVNSDGANWRIANLTGCPIGALVTNVGTGGYVQSTTVVTASAGGSTWQAIVGGAVNSAVAITNAGANYTVGYTPTLYIAPPPAGGVQATGIVTTAGGVVTAVTILNQGAGYTGVPAMLVLPNFYDPAIGTITNAVLTPGANVGAGLISALIMLTPGVPLTTTPTLTISGSGAAATATAVMAFTITAAAITTPGAGMIGAVAVIASVGGSVGTAPGAIVNPNVDRQLSTVRVANIYSVVSAGALTAAVLLDGGLFQAAPTALVLMGASSSAQGGTPVVTFTMGGSPAAIVMQPI